MTIRVVRLGSPRVSGEGPRLGTVRRPPRGVKKQDYGRLDYYDVWFPELAPSDKLVRWFYKTPEGEARWTKYVRSYRREMQQPGAQRMLQVLAQLSQQAEFSVGCYCEDEAHCHRSLLRELLLQHGAKVAA